MLKFGDLKLKCKNRDDYLDIDPNYRYRDKKTLLFHPNFVYENFLPENSNVSQYSKSEYKIVLFGILENGQKVTVILDDIYPNFQIAIPENEDEKHYLKKIINILTNNKGVSGKDAVKHKNCYILENKGFLLKGFLEERKFITIEFATVGRKQTALRRFLNHHSDVSVVNNATGNYYRLVFAQKQLPVTSWCEISNYSCKKSRNFNTAAHPFFNTQLVFQLSIDDIHKYEGDITEHKHLLNDKSIIMSFDIETYDKYSLSSNVIPQPERKTSEIFCISMNFSYIKSNIYGSNSIPETDDYHAELPNGFIECFGLCTEELNEIPNRTMVKLDNEEDLLKAFAIIFGKFKPDYVIGFNDSNYDWKWIAERAKTYKLLPFFEKHMSLVNFAPYNELEDLRATIGKSPEEVKLKNRTVRDLKSYKWYKYTSVKITKDIPAEGSTINYPGYITIDLMTHLRVYCKNPPKWSLNYFLKRFKLSSKVDMPYRKMFLIYELSKSLKNMTEKEFKKKYDTLQNKIKQIKNEKYQESVSKWFDLETSKTLDDMKKEVKFAMSNVVEYCVIDGIRCQDLLTTIKFIPDKRGIGVYSFVSMMDCIYRANGMKVRNMIAAYAYPRNLYIYYNTHLSKPDEKYHGAHVFKPDAGVKRPRADLKTFLDYNKYSYEENDLNKAYELIKEYWIYDEDYPDEIKSDMPEWFSVWLQQEHHYPIGGLDFSSLYPSIIMAYNISPEKIIFTPSRRMELAFERKYFIQYQKNKKEGKPSLDGIPKKHVESTMKKLAKTSVEYRHALIKPVTDVSLDNPRCPPKVWISRHTFSRIVKDKNGDVVLDENGKPKKMDPDDSKNNFGLTPKIMLMLFDERVNMKKELKPNVQMKEKIENYDKKEREKKEVKEAYEKYVSLIDYLNPKQKALKEMMNTFYGELGNPISPIHVLECALLITTLGQQNIKFVAKLIIDNFWRQYYGDTDSTYISPPKKSFRQLDIDYYSNPNYKRIDYFRNLIQQSFEEFKVFNVLVNEALKEDNGTEFLKMVYEELLLNSIYISKKKYGGIEHKELFNENPDVEHLFVRGLEYIKKDASDLLKEITKKILWRVLKYDAIEDMDTVIKDVIAYYYNNISSFDISRFAKSSQYKPGKKNVAVNTFVRRMRTERKINQPPYERFNTIIVEKPIEYNSRGCKKDIPIGERMEYLHIAKREGLKPDFNYYMDGAIKTQLARLLCYQERFLVQPVDNSNKEIKKADEKALDNAKKYITSIYQKWNPEGINKSGYYKNIFKGVNKNFQNKSIEIFGSRSSYIMGINWLDPEIDNIDDNMSRNEIEEIKLKEIEDMKNIKDRILSNIQKSSDSKILAEAKEFLKMRLDLIYQQHNITKSMLSQIRETKIYRIIYRQKSSILTSYRKIYRERKDQYDTFIDREFYKMYCDNEFKKILVDRNTIIEDMNSKVAALYDVNNNDDLDENTFMDTIDYNSFSIQMEKSVHSVFNSEDKIKLLLHVNEKIKKVKIKYELVQFPKTIISLLEKDMKIKPMIDYSKQIQNKYKELINAP